MTVEQVINEISSLNPCDRLRVVQAIWDGLPDAFGTMLTDSQRKELDKRWAEYKSDPTSALTEDQFRARVREVRGR